MLVAPGDCCGGAWRHEQGRHQPRSGRKWAGPPAVAIFAAYAGGGARPVGRSDSARPPGRGGLPDGRLGALS